MVHVESMIKTQYIMWLKRYKNETDGVWKKLVNFFFKKYGDLSLLMHCNYKENQFINIPEFYINILKSWRIIRNVQPEIIWNNQEFLIKGKPIFCKELFQAGLWYMYDMYDINEQVIPFNVWQSRGVKNTAYMIWRGLVEICAKLKKQVCNM